MFSHQTALRSTGLLIFEGEGIESVLVIDLIELSWKTIQIGNHLPCLNHFGFTHLNNGDFISIGGVCGKEGIVSLCSLIQVPKEYQQSEVVSGYDHQLSSTNLNQTESKEEHGSSDSQKSK
jgi:hypothetical protein